MDALPRSVGVHPPIEQAIIELPATTFWKGTDEISIKIVRDSIMMCLKSGIWGKKIVVVVVAAAAAAATSSVVVVVMAVAVATPSNAVVVASIAASLATEL